MARTTVLLSDLTGAEIRDGDAAQVRILYANDPRREIVLDVNAGEIAEFAGAGRVVSKRGRPRTEAVHG